MKQKKILFFILLLGGTCFLTYGALYGFSCRVSPEHPSTSDEVFVMISGEWSDSCVPDQLITTRSGNTFYIEITSTLPPGIGCLTVITPFTFSESLGYLEEGEYSVSVAIGSVDFTFSQFTVTNNQFILDSSSIEVPEGGSAEVRITLSEPPAGTVQVNVAPVSGDPDIIVSSGTILYFDRENYSVPQTVILTALEDADYYSNEAEVHVSAPDYVTSIVHAVEGDDDVPPVVYVDPDAGGDDNGISWVHAFPSFESALDVVSQVPGIREIRIAGGIYRTNVSMDNFAIVSGLTYSGSYAGVKSQKPDVRSIFSFPTILSSDVNGDDEPGFLNRSDNNEGVVYMQNCNSDTILDGFIISGGEEGWGGGGVFIKGGAPVIRNSIITDNRAHYGGGIHVQASGAMIHNCLIVANSANVSTIADGGGVYMNGINTDAEVTIQHCTIAHNDSGESGGGILAINGIIHVKDSIVWGNSVAYGDYSSNQLDGDFIVSYSCIQDADDLDGSDGNITADPEFASHRLGRYFLSTLESQGINSPCIDAGSDYAVSLTMDEMTTNTYLIDDSSIVDMGFHYPYYLNSIRAGDVDLNNDITIIDALLVAQVYVGLIPKIFVYEDADVNSDGLINIIDALLIARYYVGLEPDNF